MFYKPIWWFFWSDLCARHFELADLFIAINEVLMSLSASALFHVVTWLFVAGNMAILFRIVEHLGIFCCDFGIMGEREFFPMKLGLAKYLRQMVLLHGYQFLLHLLLLAILSSLVSFGHCGCEEIVLV